jgi:hypothetical protein
MGIAVKRHPVGRQGQQFLHRIRDPRAGLERQPVKDIRVQACHPARPDPFGHVTRQLIALLPPYRFLDQRVEILHPDRSAVHPRRGQRIQPRIVDLVRVDLDRELTIRRHRRHVEDRIGQPAHQVGGQQCRRPPAPVQAAERDPLRQVPSQQRNLGLQRLDIGHDGLVRGRALRPAGAEPAKPSAKRHVYVQRNRATLGQRLDPVNEVPGTNLGPEMRCRRV